MNHRSFMREPADARNAILLIHGICSSPRHYDFLMEDIDENWAVYNILLDGHGGSVRDFGNTSMKKWKAQTHSMLEMLSQRYDKILVVGYSMGTLLEIEALPQFPKIQGMLLLNVPMIPWVRLRNWSSIFTLTKGDQIRDAAISEACKRSISIQLTKDYLQYARWVPNFLELFALARYCRRHKDQIQVPCIAYLGSNDELVSMRSRKYLEGNPNVTLRIMEGGGHLIYPQESIEQIRADLRALLTQC